MHGDGEDGGHHRDCTNDLVTEDVAGQSPTNDLLNRAVSSGGEDVIDCNGLRRLYHLGAKNAENIGASP